MRDKMESVERVFRIFISVWNWRILPCESYDYWEVYLGGDVQNSIVSSSEFHASGKTNDVYQFNEIIIDRYKRKTADFHSFFERVDYLVNSRKE